MAMFRRTQGSGSEASPRLEVDETFGAMPSLVSGLFGDSLSGCRYDVDMMLGT